MSGGRRVDAVVFDYGGVLTNPGPRLDRRLAGDRRYRVRVVLLHAKAWLSRDAADGTPIHRLEAGE